ncbi:MAG: ATP-binding protein [Saprospiraceae bacterium]|nr:ATP-binding protein [Saprospiraceae bacterium]
MLQGSIKDIAISDDGRIWLANQYGLTLFDPATEDYRLYTRRDGLQQDPLNAVMIGRDGRIWVSGHQFYAVLDPASDRFTSFDVGKQIKAFWSKGRFLDSNGRVYFCGLNGIYTFHPDSIRQDTSTPPVVLTDFMVKDSTYALDTAFEYVREITLRHDQNDIAFTFAGILMSNPDRLLYRCRLEGYDNKWRYLGNERTVNYTNLNDGSYQFRAQTANSDGIWSSKDLSIQLMITPHFTNTGWFRVLIGLLVLSIAYAAFRVRQHQLELKRQKEIAEQAADFRLRFLTNVSHEIRTPMNAIIGMSGLAREGAESPEQTRYLSAIEHASKNLLAIVNELLDHAKIASGSFRLDRVPFTLRDHLEQLTSALSVLTEEKPVALQTHIDDDVPDRLEGDPLRLSQILTNLLGNAIKYTHEGTVTLKVATASRQADIARLRFQIRDTGIGMTPETLEYVFEPFSGGRGTESGASSTGLGLHITRQLVELQGGEIALASAVNQGTTVTVEIPYGMTSSTIAPQPATDGQLRLDQLQVLLVDDAPFNHMVVTEMLKKRVESLDIKTATDGSEAVQLAQQHDFDLIIMDAKMPGMDGLEATRRIRALTTGKAAEIPILGATAGAMPEQIDACLESGMNDVITKPVMIDELIRKIRQLTQTPGQ